jgi:hypothetical protein
VITSTIYQIRISGWLDPSWADWFDGLIIRHTEDGMTILIGPLPDQAALHGVLNKIRDLGLTLLTVTTETAVNENEENKDE